MTSSALQSPFCLDFPWPPSSFPDLSLSTPDTSKIPDIPLSSTSFPHPSSHETGLDFSFSHDFSLLYLSLVINVIALKNDPNDEMTVPHYDHNLSQCMAFLPLELSNMKHMHYYKGICGVVLLMVLCLTQRSMKLSTVTVPSDPLITRTCRHSAAE